MANKIKYNTSLEVPNGAIKINNFNLGTNTDGPYLYSPTSATGFWNGISPPLGGYTIYLNKATQGPSIYVANDQIEAQIIANMFGANTEFKLWFFQQSDKVCVDMTYPDIITANLIILYDSSFLPSYPTVGNSIKDLSFRGNVGTLTNITYLSADKCLEFGVNGFISFRTTDDFNFRNGRVSVCAYIKFKSSNISSNEPIISFSDDSRNNYIFFGRNGLSNDLKVESFERNSKKGEAIFQNAIIDDQFAFYAFTINSQQTTIYVNRNTHTENQNLTVGDVAFTNSYIGKISGNQSYFGGSLNNILIYNDSLSNTMLDQNYYAYITRYGP